MVRLFLLLAVFSGVLSVLAFQQGGPLPGVIFALVAASPVIALVVSLVRTRRNGGERRPFGRGARIAVAVVSVAGLVGAGYSAYWMFLVPKASDAELTSASALEKVCHTPRKYFPDAAAFTGAGPHPIAIFLANESDGLDHDSLDYSAPAAWNPKDPRTVQLVACFDDVDSGPFLADCTFTSGSLPQYQGRYRGTVYEAHTGKEVGSVAVSGKNSSDCPFSALTKGDNPRLHTEPDLAEYQRALGTYVGN
ncbi:hypothetical protein [Nocardia thailandica]|uniref:hypothetical protein n=1 Tax=Nocardia thailandica TaxID=257275 RepID=UPI000302E488|nr:hypothetical protein [Nocardia thailandica]